MDWTDQAVSDSAKGMEIEMSNLAAGFAKRMHKQATNAQGETSPGSECPDGKRFEQSGPAEEVKISSIVISVDFIERAPSALPTSKGDA